MPIINPNFTRSVQKLYNDKVLNSKTFEKNIYTPAWENAAKYAGKMALISALTKDAVGCYYYVTQSLNNDKIPEEKRNFVASLDLMNGILNVALQFTVGMWIDKKVPEWFDKTVGKKLDTDETVKQAKKIFKTIQKLGVKNNIKEVDIADFLRDNVLGPSGRASKFLKGGFTAAAVLIGTQIITKRVIVPFLSTPLATWYKENYMDKKKTNPAKPNTDAVEINKVASKPFVPQSNVSNPQQKSAFDQFTKR